VQDHQRLGALCLEGDRGDRPGLAPSSLVHARREYGFTSMRAGPLMVRVTTTSRCDFRSTVVRFFAERGLLSILAFIALLLSCQFLDNPVQLVEACAQRWRYLSSHAISSSNRRGPSWLRPHAPDLLGRDEPRLLQNADVLLRRRARRTLTSTSKSTSRGSG
jgi:hypothetical protein